MTVNAIAEDDKSSFYSSDYYTDVSGGQTFVVNYETIRPSKKRFRAGLTSTDAKSATLGVGKSLSLGMGTDSSKSLYYDTDWSYWNFPGVTPPDKLEVILGNVTITKNTDQFSFSLIPIVRNLHFMKAPNQTTINSIGLGYSGTYYVNDKWFVELGGEESRYYGNQTVMKIIFNALRASGNAPFVSGLNLSRVYTEVGYQFRKSVIVLGYEQGKIVVTPNKYSKSLYLTLTTELSKSWSLNTNYGINTLSGSDWYGSVGLTYSR